MGRIAAEAFLAAVAMDWSPHLALRSLETMIAVDILLTQFVSSVSQPRSCLPRRVSVPTNRNYSVAMK